MKKITLLYFIILFMFSFIYFCPIKNVKGSSSWEIDDTGNVSYIVDGDTFDVQDLGRIRLADIDAPESGDSGYQEAKNHIISLIYDKTVCLDIDDKYRTDIYGRIVAVTYIRHNSTHFLNVNKDMLDRNFAVIMNYDNEFDPSEWTLYVNEIVSDTPSATDDDDNDDSDDSSYDYGLDNGVKWLIVLGIVGGAMSVAGGVVYNNYRQTKARNMISPQQKSARKISQRQYNYQNSEPPKKIIKEKRLRYCDKCGNLMDFHTNYGIKVMKCVSCGKVNALRRVDLDFYHEREAKKNNKLMSIEEKRIRNWFDQYKKMRII